MDTEQELTSIMQPCTAQQRSATQLFVGVPSAVAAYVITYLQKQLCSNQNCGTCAPCSNIALKNHYAVTWIAPKDRYTLEDIEPLMHTVSLQLDEDAHHYIIIEQADMLTPICANTLLKTIEEPPRGYHIILLAHTIDHIIPTVRSRCLITLVRGNKTSIDHQLITYFTHKNSPNSNNFAKLLEQSKITEQESAQLLDALLQHLLDIMRELYVHNQAPDSILKHRYAIVKHMCSRMQMPGSAKIIWRELFLQWNLY